MYLPLSRPMRRFSNSPENGSYKKEKKMFSRFSHTFIIKLKVISKVQPAVITL